MFSQGMENVTLLWLEVPVRLAEHHLWFMFNHGMENVTLLSGSTFLCGLQSIT